MYRAMMAGSLIAALAIGSGAAWADSETTYKSESLRTETVPAPPPAVEHSQETRTRVERSDDGTEEEKVEQRVVRRAPPPPQTESVVREKKVETRETDD